MSEKVPAIYLVEWVDSHSFGQWRSQHEWEKHATPERLLCTSVGFVVVDNDSFLLLAQSRGNDVDDETCYSDTIMIPRVCIVSSRCLCLPNGASS